MDYISFHFAQMEFYTTFDEDVRGGRVVFG